MNQSTSQPANQSTSPRYWFVRFVDAKHGMEQETMERGAAHLVWALLHACGRIGEWTWARAVAADSPMLLLLTPTGVRCECDFHGPEDPGLSEHLQATLGERFADRPDPLINRSTDQPINHRKEAAA